MKPRIVGVDVVGQKLQRRIAVVQRLHQVLAADAAAQAAVVVGHGELGVEPDRLAVVGDGVVVVALGEIREAAVVADVGCVGDELDRLVEVGDRAVWSSSRA